MMNDVELRESAAKAFGLAKFLIPWAWELGECDPLDDDGDAMRMAVRLGMTISVTNGPAGWTSVGFWVKEKRMDYREAHQGDPDGATRRAIVRAAAEIGRQMDAATSAADSR